MDIEGQYASSRAGSLSSTQRPQRKKPRKVHHTLGRASSTRFATVKGAENIEEDGSLDGCFEMLDSFLCKQDAETRKNSLSKPFNLKFAFRSSPKKPKTKSTDAVTGPSGIFKSHVSKLIMSSEEFIQAVYAFFSGNSETTSSVDRCFEKTINQLKEAVSLFQKESLSNPVEQILLQINDAIDNAPLTGTPDEAVIANLKEDRKSVISNVVISLKHNVQEQLLNIRSFNIQLIGALSVSNAVMFASLAYSFLKNLEEILNDLQTVTELLKIFSSLQTSTNSICESLSELDIDLNIWDDDNEDMPEGTGTLNSLVKNLTSTTTYESNYTKSFTMTYRAFTTPWKLLHKLKQRFEDIPDAISDGERSQIELRVCIVLKYWIETKYMDFDSQLLKTMREFLNGSVTIRNSEMATRLLSTLEQKTVDSLLKFEAVTVSPFSPKLIQHYYAKSVTQISLLKGFSTETICKQLTLIDNDMFQKVDVVGFLNKSWDKPALKHRAASLITFMQRLNNYSHWVASVILIHSKLADRVEQLRLIIQIAFELLEIHKNFQAVAGIVVGLNLAAVSRLKHTFAALSKKEKATMDHLNEFMNPHGSYVTYRNILHSKTLPVIPYIAVYLSDLTFIDEGNPDMIDGYINYSKHDLVYNALREILVYKQSRYEYEENLLLQNYLSALPSLDTKMLYDLSLHYEPRGSDVSQIA